MSAARQLLYRRLTGVLAVAASTAPRRALRQPEPKLQQSQATEKANRSKKGDADLIEETSDQDIYTPAFESDDEGSWSLFSQGIDSLLDSIGKIKLSGLGDKVVDFVLPSWARLLPAAIKKLQFEITMEPGTLADEIWEEAHDPSINPEILWQADVRIGTGLGRDELRFRDKRKAQMVGAFAKYLDLKEKDIDPEDIPIIAMCGSGGGLRALVAGTSSYQAAKQAGLFDITMYTSGVSGSCWLEALFYSKLGKGSHADMLKHIKSRVGTHIAFPPPALKLATSAPTNKFILSGFIEKLKGDPNATFGLVDIYSLLLAARLMVPHGDLDIHSEDLKLSNQRTYIQDGQLPMPIYTCVRHEIPIEEEEKANKSNQETQETIREKAKKEAWFQWIEMHPWEVGCEEFGAWIPTWSLGRPFNNGRSQILDTGVAVPEYRISLLLGIWGSAFTATMSHYIKEIKPLLTGITGWQSISQLLEEKNEDLVKIHPIDPATIPNFAYGMKDKLPSTCPESIHKSDHLQLMDAGMSNNLPIYPLLREGRDVDILVAFDASADIQQENCYPSSTATPSNAASKALTAASAATAAEAANKLKEAKAKDPAKQKEAEKRETETGASPDLTTCNIWVGTKQSRDSVDEPPLSKRLAWDDPSDSTFHLMQPDAGIAVIYFPLLPNDKVPGVDPDKSDFLSTWNFIYTPEQVDQVVELASTNFKEGEDATKRTVRAVYERKRKARMEREQEGVWKSMRRRMAVEGDSFGG
ncbi:Cytosolic phospholipase A2 [Cyphellophora attinorum]|uniref:Lysophospholipase n=1 Tax=Cyphellophora attinorum TaxID=1664694 RepID=A0A0N1HEV5_9EURO|nr:Cytosolic phospholipase A2 [Phialophora attinorum]KPI43504.1 Cytosolic phospholipase A2 [Phialophora attinorum]